MSGSILDGTAETIQALDHGAGFGVLGNSRGSVIVNQSVGAGIIGVFWRAIRSKLSTTRGSRGN